MNLLNRVVNSWSLTVCLLAVLLPGCNIVIGPSLRGSGVAKTESREVGGFSEIEVGNAIQLDVVVGEPAEVTVSADDNILPLVKTVLAGDRLKIYVDESFSTDLGVQVKITTPELKALEGSGASRITAGRITGDAFSLGLSGASTCDLASDAEALEVTLSGASRSSLVGVTQQLTIECSGASHVDATKLTADKVHAEVSGASSARVFANQELAATASGASNVRYAGNPAKVAQDVSGASTVAAQ
jgi:hypothetical protein